MLRVELRRALYFWRIGGTVLQECWRTRLPSTGTDWRQVSFLVVDAEMSSLDVNEGELLSVGWVSVEKGSISLGSARHYLIKPTSSVGQSATIHHLRDCELHDALPGPEVLNYFLQAAAGRILVFHNAALDMAFLNRVSKRSFSAPILMPVVDTMMQEKKLLDRKGLPIHAGDLRLQACRDRYNLPQFPAHNALLDALATAELLVAQAKHRSRGKDFSIGHLL